jgi:hypothetical protein
MYTMLDDQRKGNFIKEYIETHPNCTIKDVIQETVTNRVRLKYLERQGYFKLPNPLSREEILAKRFKNRNYVSVEVGREYGKWIGY